MTTITLVLGVNDFPYSGPPQSPRKVAKARKGKQKPRGEKRTSHLASTRDVAQILEDKYGIMGQFAERYMPEIVGAVSHSLIGEIKNIVEGKPLELVKPFDAAMSEIEEGFKVFLDQREMDGAAGVPTKAALRGINHTLLHPYAKSNPSRPSFVDTGIFRANFRAWVETE